MSVAQFRHLTQMVLHDPPNSYGDCQRTCLAMVIGCDPADVPHFADERLFSIDDNRAAEREWLRSRGFSYVQLPILGAWGFDWVLNVLRESANDTPVIVTGKSPRGKWHHDVVVYQGIVFDPHPDQTGLSAPCFDDDKPDDLPWFWVNVIAPADLPVLASVGRNAERQDRKDGLGRNDEHAVSATSAETPDPSLSPCNHTPNTPGEQ